MSGKKRRCKPCKKVVRLRQEGIQCDGCDKWQHRRCVTGISREVYRDALRSGEGIDWRCEDCVNMSAGFRLPNAESKTVVRYQGLLHNSSLTTVYENNSESSIMAAWDITLSNRTGSKVDVMIFQTMPDALIYGSYFAAWKVMETPNPGNIRLELPETFEFCVIEYLKDDVRQTGPYKVSYGDEVKVSQPDAAKAPTVTVNLNENIPKDQIKVINLSGNAQPLEMALFKKDSKMVFYKNIVPNAFVFMAIKPSVYLAVVGPVTQGQEFLATSFVDEKIVFKSYHIDQVVDRDEEDAYLVQAESDETVECLVNDQTVYYSKATHFNEMVGYSVPAEFKLPEDRPVIKMQIIQKKSGEYVFKPG